MAERSSWLGSLLQHRGIARGDLAGGLTAALVLPAIEGSYGLVAFAPLGAEHASYGFLLGACTAAVACIVSVLAGGRGPMLSGSSAALALLLASMIGWLAADPRFLGADGRPVLPMLLAFTSLGLVLAGVMQAVVARLKLGGLVRYVPYPVHAGYMNGTAVLMLGAMLAAGCAKKDDASATRAEQAAARSEDAARRAEAAAGRVEAAAQRAEAAAEKAERMFSKGLRK